MNQMNVNKTSADYVTIERRASNRYVSNSTVALMSGEDEFLGRLVDISPNGAQVEVDEREMEALNFEIDALRLPGQPRLSIRLVWGAGDTIGTEFTGPSEHVEPIVDAFLMTTSSGDLKP